MKQGKYLKNGRRNLLAEFNDGTKSRVREYLVAKSGNRKVRVRLLEDDTLLLESESPSNGEGTKAMHLTLESAQLIVCMLDVAIERSGVTRSSFEIGDARA